jgi:hypothetical protein
MSDYPTLRVGEAAPEGWLEYLHALLNEPVPHWQAAYDQQMADRIKQYQHEKHLTEDGVVGDQTWASLRGEALPHDPAANPSFHEKKLELRFTQEIDYVDGDDVLFVRAMSVGSHNPADGEVTLTVEVRRPDGISNHLSATNEALGAGTDLHTFYVKSAVGDGPGGVYHALMWFPQEMGQDNQTYEFNHVPQ